MSDMAENSTPTVGTITLDELESSSVVAHKGQLHADDYNTDGSLKTTQDELALVVQSSEMARKFIIGKQWSLLWRDADLLFQSPRPMTVYENTYVLEPNVQRFTVAKVCNAVVPQLYKGLFYDDPPMLLRPRPGTPQEIVDSKKALMSYILDSCDFKNQTKWGLEQMSLLGTGIWKWGYDWKTITTRKRKSTSIPLTVGEGENVETASIPTEVPPDIVVEDKVVPLPFFEWRPIDKVLVDPQLNVADIRQARWVIDVRYMDFYQMKALKESIEGAIKNKETGDSVTGWKFPSEEDLMKFWANNSQAQINLGTENTAHIQGVVHHSEKVNVQVSPDQLRSKKEILEYWDEGRKIIVFNNNTVIYSGENEFKQIPFLSANWWNRPRAFYGMGLGIIVGQNQRVDQGSINAILKILSFGANPVYMRNRDDNAPTQMIRTNLGKIITVANTKDGGYKLLETPKVPSDLWNALRESEQATESTSGADQTLVQGSTAGPRTSMGRTASGANLLAGASATRLDGPLDNFIEQVFKPFLGVIDMLIFNVMSDHAIQAILGKIKGDEFLKTIDMQKFWNAHINYEVLAGASLSAKRTMAQSLVMLTQILQNPQLQDSLADINEQYIDYLPIVRMWLEASEWKNENDIIKPMTEEMKKKRAANTKAALMAQQVQAKQADSQQKFQQKSQLEDQASDNRIKRDIVREAARASGMSEAVEGVPSPQGLEGEQPTVE
ncbi:MAG: hypothetical protein C5B59_08720 [Bacteroidetes bacterium]|nr:MAG: hypothetical protein C5B59_08720 [Bacteroidota bacterium]